MLLSSGVTQDIVVLLSEDTERGNLFYRLEARVGKVAENCETRKREKAGAKILRAGDISFRPERSSRGLGSRGGVVHRERMQRDIKRGEKWHKKGARGVVLQ